MKTMLFLLLCGMTFCLPFKNKPVSTETTNTAQPAFAEATVVKADTISFTTQIQPILQTRCNPCHFPGGKMYEKMPFDQPKTITGHPEGILKRFTEEAENKLLRQFIEEAGK